MSNIMVSRLTDAGILVKRIGTSKKVSAYDLADFMSRDKVIPYYKG